MKLIREHNLNGETIKATIGHLLDKVVFFLESGNACIVERYENDRYSRCMDNGWGQIKEYDLSSIAYSAKELGFDIGDKEGDLGFEIAKREELQHRNDFIQFLIDKCKFEANTKVFHFVVVDAIDTRDINNLDIDSVVAEILAKQAEIDNKYNSEKGLSRDRG